MFIHVDVSNSSPSLSSYMDGSINYYKKAHGSGFTLIGSNTNSLLSGNFAYMILFKVDNAGTMEKSLQIGAIKGGKVYSIG